MFVSSCVIEPMRLLSDRTFAAWLPFMTIGPQPNSYCIDRSANTDNWMGQ
jgi:hypothetical protein